MHQARDAAVAPYTPLNVLKPVAADLWIVDGPTIRFPFNMGMPFPTRMTIVRAPGQGLFVHSPTVLTPDLHRQVLELGPVRWLIAPNRLHHAWIAPWAAAFPDAAVFAAPGVDLQGTPSAAAQSLDRLDGYPWSQTLDTLPVIGRYMTEVVFFHHRSRTLILTDLFENFEPARVRSRLLRWLIRIGGVAAPHGGLSLDLRMTFPRAVLTAAVARMVAWDPERIILAHGRWIPAHGTAELRRAYRAWLDDAAETPDPQNRHLPNSRP